MNELIVVDDGNNPVNGLSIQNISCVVYDGETLDILATAATHNRAEEKANSIFVDSGRKVDARADMLRYGGELLNLVGMKMNQFQFFVNTYPTHPLVKA